MLLEISIQDFAIIHKLDVNFNANMTVLTGETGAGKSIIIDAVGLLAGGRGSTDFIRSGSEKAVLQGVFSIGKSESSKKIVQELGIEDTDELIITRELQKNGRNVCRVNGTIVNLNNLKQLGQTLIDIHGQNEHQELMDKERHLALLDHYDSAKLLKLKESYLEDYRNYRSVKAKYDKYRNNEQEFNQRLDMLEFQVQEIHDADLKVDEDKELEQRRIQLDNFQKISEALNSSFQILEGQDEVSVTAQLGTAMQSMDSISSFDKDYAEMSDEVQSAYYAVEDVTARLQNAIDSLEWDENELNEIQQRLETIHQLKKKYGDSIEEILEYYSKIKSELSAMTGNSSSLEDLEKEVQDNLEQVLKSGKLLANERHRMAESLEKEIRAQLKDLYMDKTQFKVQFTEKDEPDADGLEEIEFLIQPNIGEELKPLVKIASGGELSRVMLALKTVFTRNEDVQTIVFDEVDTGVSGRVAQSIADKMHDIAKSCQVLCISHLTQVAARADYQLHVEKQVVNNRTLTNIKQLDVDGRVNEIARMLSGVNLTDLSLQNARELLEMEHK